MSEEHIQALDLATQGDWDAAHQLIQKVHDELDGQIHGYLHREEGNMQAY